MQTCERTVSVQCGKPLIWSAYLPSNLRGWQRHGMHQPQSHATHLHHRACAPAPCIVASAIHKIRALRGAEGGQRMRAAPAQAAAAARRPPARAHPRRRRPGRRRSPPVRGARARPRRCSPATPRARRRPRPRPGRSRATRVAARRAPPPPRPRAPRTPRCPATSHAPA